jgi:SAM-dependent methyltransferase
MTTKTGEGTQMATTQRELSREESVWAEMGPDHFETAQYEHPAMLEAFDANLDVLRALLRSPDVLVDAGCGTGNLIGRLIGYASVCMGVDINDGFLSVARRRHATSLAEGTSLFVQGDGCDLRSVVDRHAEEIGATGRRIVSCTMNTIGILPTDVRSDFATAMVDCARPDGLVVIGALDAGWFPQAVTDYYVPNPQMCGTLTMSDVDLVRHELRIASSGYFTHWFEVDELRDLLSNAGARDVTIVTRGSATIGVGRAGG